MKDIFNNHKEIGLFNNGDYLVYSFKKTEKIVSAIYLVTSLIKDNEPLKWELRELSMSLISLITTLNGSEPIDRNAIFQNYFSTSIQIIEFIKISNNSRLMSEMNCSVLIKEIESLLDFMRDQSKVASDTAGYILSDTFFQTDHANVAPRIPFRNNLNQNNAINVRLEKDIQRHIKDKKNSRRDSILNILSKNSDLTIKDFAKVIIDCSEKTIQRELLVLVEVELFTYIQSSKNTS
jgi:hypothetical protein